MKIGEDYIAAHSGFGNIILDIDRDDGHVCIPYSAPVVAVQTRQIGELPDMEALADDTHAANVQRGWWTNLATGETTLATRNRGELMMLVVSELSEAAGGRAAGLMDDKLTDLPMFDVELADVAIRLLDMIGAERSLHGFAFPARIFRQQVETSEVADLMDIVNLVSAAMEHHRKGRVHPYYCTLLDALADTIAYAIDNEVDLFTVMQRKSDFNATRADHQIENRLKDGGKAY